jgi:penicillin-binding protein 1C
LRRLDREAQPVWRDAAPLRILFPPDGATIEWQQGSMPLRAEGGTGALAWIVDGVPITGSRFAAETEWRPEGEGFVRIAVVDARGRTAAVRVRLCSACR